MKYENWLNEWLDNCVRLSVKRRTYVRYKELVHDHIAVKLGNYELGELSPLVLQRFVRELVQSGNCRTGRGLAASSVNGIITVVQNSLKAAFSFGLSGEYVADRISRPKPREKEITCFTASEQKILENAVRCGTKTKMYGIMICLYTGLRIGELLALTWNDVDLKGGTLSVNKTCCDGKDDNGKFTRLVGTPKTASSNRIIPMPRQLTPFLHEMKKRSVSENVVTGMYGQTVSVRAYQRSFASFLKRLHIAHKGFHALRHTFASRALECGMDVKTLSEILGHKNATITLNRYVHTQTDHKREMMNRVGRLMT
ncbi:MAG: site-specific integrase [Clostridia bacterium]|nr:site-specific integrase [Clostridia bacterium]